jgi:hypothetical protein
MCIGAHSCVSVARAQADMAPTSADVVAALSPPWHAAQGHVEFQSGFGRPCPGRTNYFYRPGTALPSADVTGIDHQAYSLAAHAKAVWPHISGLATQLLLQVGLQAAPTSAPAGAAPAPAPLFAGVLAALADVDARAAHPGATGAMSAPYLGTCGGAGAPAGARMEHTACASSLAVQTYITPDAGAAGSECVKAHVDATLLTIILPPAGDCGLEVFDRAAGQMVKPVQFAGAVYGQDAAVQIGPAPAAGGCDAEFANASGRNTGSLRPPCIDIASGDGRVPEAAAGPGSKPAAGPSPCALRPGMQPVVVVAGYLLHRALGAATGMDMYAAYCRATQHRVLWPDVALPSQARVSLVQRVLPRHDAVLNVHDLAVSAASLSSARAGGIHGTPLLSSEILAQFRASADSVNYTPATPDPRVAGVPAAFAGADLPG